MNVMFLVAIIGLVLAMTVWLKSQRIGPPAGVLMATFVIMALTDTSILTKFSKMIAGTVGDLGEKEPGAKGDGIPSPSSKATPSSEATSTPSPSETPASPAPQVPESTTNWRDVWMTVGLIAACIIVLIFAAWLVVTLVRRSKVKHREYTEAREKAKVAKEQHEALMKKIAVIWKEATEKQDALDAEYLSYQKDLQKIARYPLMTELSVPLTKKAVRAMTVARNQRPAVAPIEMGEVEKYREVVTSFEIALRAAVANAKREGLKNFSEKEQKDLIQAQDLLRMAEDSQGNPNQRRMAYERAIKTLQGILGEVPEEALLEIEARAKEDGIMLALTA